MFDDIDRECCGSIERAIKEGLPYDWSLLKRKFHDPGMTLVLQHKDKWGAVHPKVTVRISYGDNR